MLVQARHNQETGPRPLSGTPTPGPAGCPNPMPTVGPVMSRVSVASLVNLLREQRFLLPEQLAELPEVERSASDPRGLVREMVRRSWLTVFQSNHLLDGRAHELSLGPYRILDRLGAGGISQVFKAFHAQDNTLVALKTIRLDLTGHADAERQFEGEISTLSRLSHRNIITLLDSGRDGDRQYFAMEFLEGIDLGKFVQLSGALPVSQACDVIRQVAHGLQTAHQSGLVHRDIKPANLFLIQATQPRYWSGPNWNRSPRQEIGQIKILDWGLSCPQQRPPDGAASSSGGPDGALIGTADYLAPEQIQNPAAVDIRADLYSLGCTFYYLLTGHPPFPGASLMQKLLQHAQNEPAPLQSRRPDIPAPLAGLVHKLLAKRPEDRYQTPLAVTITLGRFCRPSNPAHPRPQ
jgi:eukaryotic-like serine/threonine-protein kinase